MCAQKAIKQRLQKWFHVHSWQKDAGLHGTIPKPHSVNVSRGDIHTL
jgi:hypothetical protein